MTTNSHASAKRSTPTMILFGMIFFCGTPARAQVAYSYTDRYGDCMMHLAASQGWSNYECEHVAKGETWSGMTPEARAFAEASTAEIRATARAAAHRKNLAKPTAPAIVAITPVAGTVEAQPDAAFDILLATFFWFLGACLYLLPGIIGQNRHHHQRAAIWVLNIFLGWTVLGWLAALIWAYTATPGAAKPQIKEYPA